MGIMLFMLCLIVAIFAISFYEDKKKKQREYIEEFYRNLEKYGYTKYFELFKKQYKGTEYSLIKGFFNTVAGDDMAKKIKEEEAREFLEERDEERRKNYLIKNIGKYSLYIYYAFAPLVEDKVFYTIPLESKIPEAYFWDLVSSASIRISQEEEIEQIELLKDFCYKAEALKLDKDGEVSLGIDMWKLSKYEEKPWEEWYNTKSVYEHPLLDVCPKDEFLEKISLWRVLYELH